MKSELNPSSLRRARNNPLTLASSVPTLVQFTNVCQVPTLVGIIQEFAFKIIVFPLIPFVSIKKFNDPCALDGSGKALLKSELNPSSLRRVRHNPLKLVCQVPTLVGYLASAYSLIS